MNKFERLAEALRSVRVTSSEVMDVPKGTYVLDMLVARAVIDPEVLLNDEPEILEAIKHFPELKEALLSHDVDRTSYINLGGIVGSQDLALRVGAALVTLHRAKMLTLRDIPGILNRTDMVVTYERAAEAAGRGYLSFVGSNLEPEAKAEKIAEAEGVSSEG